MDLPAYPLETAACTTSGSDACFDQQYEQALSSWNCSLCSRYSQGVLSRAKGSLAHLKQTAALLAPASSAELIESCWANRSHLVGLRVPRTASTTFLLRLNTACNRSKTNLLWFHNAPLSDSCAALSAATLRDPCERFESIYRGLENAYNPKVGACQRSPGHCREHWVHSANTVDDFVHVVAAHWSEVIGVSSLSLSDRGLRPLPFDKHQILAVPQALYVGTHTIRICQLDSELPSVVNMLGCERAVNGSLVFIDSQQVKADTANKYKLSADGCRGVRRLYWRDTVLWESSCRKTRNMQ